MNQRKQIAELAAKNGYQIKGLKTFKGMEGCGGFNCNLLRYGKKIAEVVNDDSGGETMFHWLDKKEELKIKALCDKVDPVTIQGIEIKCDMDIFISHMITNLEEENSWRCKCRTQTLVLLKSLGDKQYLQYKAPYDKEIADMIRQKYGDDLDEIVNERYLVPAK